MKAEELIKILEKNPQMEVCFQIDDGIYTSDFVISQKDKVYDAEVWGFVNTFYDGSESKDVRSFDEPKTVFVVNPGFSQ